MARYFVVSLGLKSLVFSLLVLPASIDTIVSAQTAPASASVPAAQPYAPGLGDFMTAYVQPHHIKLWLAGSTGNWSLAAYEASELGETFEDVATYAPTWKGVPVAELVKAIMDPALKNVDAAIASKQVVGFKRAYAAFTAACNACHITARHAFINIRVPTGNPYSDQNFSSATASRER